MGLGPGVAVVGLSDVPWACMGFGGWLAGAGKADGAVCGLACCAMRYDRDVMRWVSPLGAWAESWPTSVEEE